MVPLFRAIVKDDAIPMETKNLFIRKSGKDISVNNFTQIEMMLFSFFSYSRSALPAPGTKQKDLNKKLYIVVSYGNMKGNYQISALLHFRLSFPFLPCHILCFISIISYFVMYGFSCLVMYGLSCLIMYGLYGLSCLIMSCMVYHVLSGMIYNCLVLSYHALSEYCMIFLVVVPYHVIMTSYQALAFLARPFFTWVTIVVFFCFSSLYVHLCLTGATPSKHMKHAYALSGSSIDFKTVASLPIDHGNKYSYFVTLHGRVDY